LLPPPRLGVGWGVAMSDGVFTNPSPNPSRKRKGS
jgi:hypothetical protein